MAVLSISITTTQQESLKELINTGMYGNVSEAVREAIRLLLKQKEAETYKQWFNKEVKKGLADVKNKRFSKKTFTQLIDEVGDQYKDR
ncbi:MAG: hypothetical protein WCK98_04410 [bacterium]